MRNPRVGRGLCVVLVLSMTGSSTLAQRTSDLRDQAFRLYDAGDIARQSLSLTPSWTASTATSRR